MRSSIASLSGVSCIRVNIAMDTIQYYDETVSEIQPQTNIYDLRSIVHKWRQTLQE
jgi:hypothetical protein